MPWSVILKISVFPVLFGATLEGAYTGEIIRVLDNRHEFVEPLPITYVYAQSQGNVTLLTVPLGAQFSKLEVS
jgi:hypothetical protein